ncbi:MAG: trypsin-like peptidase domain-containing protein [Anaerolineaceae bacterium]|nr:trypsin-like peptidase domain-containing protein [Anaerolineaceae bacterium]
MMSRITFLAALLALILALPPSPIHAQQLEQDLERIQRATVFIMQAENVGDELIVTCVGSGTLVSRDGLIITNAHNTLQDTACPGETLIVALTITPGEPPVPKYRAEIAQADPGLDIALLRINRELDGRLIESSSLALPFVELADSSATQLDQTITVVGYPGIGSDSVGIARGTIVGFTAEPRGGDKAWIKTSAVIPGTMSGGGAYNAAGQLIGIPTTAPITSLGTDTSCQPLQDTNGDGLVNNNDICIPVGGFINALRPASFARPLLRGAALGLTVTTPDPPGSQFSGTGTPTFKNLFFAPSVNEAGMPTAVIGNLPAGSTGLYLFFDYANMTPETVYELRVTTNGIPNPTFSLAPVRWSGGENGLWYIGSANQPWANGVYEFTLFVNGVTSGTARLNIGGAAELSPTFRDIVFGILDLRGNPLGNGFVLPTGNVAGARFIYQNMENGVEWVSLWYYNGVEFSRQTNTWDAGANGDMTTSIQASNGLLPGTYRLELYISGRLAAKSDLVIAGSQQGAYADIFTNLHFTTANSASEALSASPISNFPSAVRDLYALADWQQIGSGTIWTMRWSVDGNIFYEQIVPWSQAESGAGYLVQLSDPTSIPDGTYRVEFLINNLPLAAAEAQVGIGQLPIDRFAQAGGVQLRGKILDTDTRQGIPGVTFILISEDFSVSEFVDSWDQNMIYALAVTDENGEFELDRPLQFDAPYSVVIAADGYLPITADGVEITAETKLPLDLTIYLTRD